MLNFVNGKSLRTWTKQWEIFDNCMNIRTLDTGLNLRVYTFPLTLVNDRAILQIPAGLIPNLPIAYRGRHLRKEGVGHSYPVTMSS